MCADCHSTKLQKNYDLDRKEYNTTWSGIDVSCEACHGPASNHLDWAKNNTTDIKNKGFSIVFDKSIYADGIGNSVTDDVKHNHSKKKNTEIEMCAKCHSRRSTNFPDSRPEHKLLNNYQPALLTEPLYHVDGQVNDEVFVYGSFLQSKMYQIGRASCRESG